MAMPPQRRLNTSQSEASINSALSSRKREQLLAMRQREHLKDALVDKFKGRFGTGSQDRHDDEGTVVSSVIQQEVADFTSKHHVSERNLGRLEKRLQGKARKRGSDEETGVSAVSAYTGLSGASGMSRSRSCGMAGQSILSSNVPHEAYDWQKMDEYAAHLHEQDAIRQRQGVVALQRKLRADLDNQVAMSRAKKANDEDEDQRHHTNMLQEIERWKEQEQERAEDMKRKAMKSKIDRDEQMAFNKRNEAAAVVRKKEEEESQLQKIVNEMETERVRYAATKVQQKQKMKKIFDDNAEDQQQRTKEQRKQQARDFKAAREYNDLLDKQDEEKAEELANRMERQKQLMDKMKENTAQASQQASDNDTTRAAAQAEEMDRHYYEAEKAKQRRLKQMRNENKDYLFKQMDEKYGRKDDDKELGAIQAAMLTVDTREFNQLEKARAVQKRQQNFKNRQALEAQMTANAGVTQPLMSEHERNMNKGLVKVVHRQLQACQA